MLPTGHVEFTWAALNLLQRKAGLFHDADYRLIALAALAPDLLDKPLALTVYRDTDAALFWGHNLWFHLGVWLVAWGVISVRAWKRRDCQFSAQGKRPSQGLRWGPLAYLLAFSGHLLADRMWGFQESLFYPLGAGYWHPWMHVGAPQAMLDAYLHIIRTTPIIVAFEVIGLGLLAWFIWERRLWRRDRLMTWLRTGRFAAAGLDSKLQNRGFCRSPRERDRLKPRAQKV